MEMDRQTIMVLCCAIIGLTLFGGVYLSSSSPAKREVHERPLYAQEDIRYKFQQEDARKPRPKKPEPVAEPTIVTNKTTGISSSKPKRLSSSKPSGGGEHSSEEESSDESSNSEDDEPQEEPPLD